MHSNQALQNEFKTIDQAQRNALKLQLHHIAEQKISVVDQGHLAIATLARIEKMMKLIQSNKEQPFEVSITGRGTTYIKINSVGKLFNALASLPSKQVLSHSLPMKVFSPSVELLLKLLDGQEWRYVTDPHFVMFDGRVAALHFNNFIELLRGMTHQAEFKKKMAIWHGRASKNHKGAVKYLYRVLNKHKRLRVVRLDLSYQINQPERNDAVLCKKHFKRFTENKRNKQLFKHVVGFIWRLEYGKQMGFHYHWILLFDGNHIRKEEWYADQIGQYWRDQITAGQGSFHNCNYEARVKGYRDTPNYGLGELKLNDRDKLDVVCKNVIGYLTKVDELIQSASIEGKTFGRGIIK